jgi:nucleotide-binding universal stress UspA family protein
MDDTGSQQTPSDEEVAIVMAAIDTSSLATTVVEFAARLARRNWPSSQLHLVHVQRVGRFDRPSHAGIRPEELEAEAQSYLDHYVRLARKQCPSPVTAHLLRGDPVDEVVERARSLKADLLILGTHDNAGLERFLMGSVAEKVARHAPCSVTIVRRKERPYVKVEGNKQGG